MDLRTFLLCFSAFTLAVTGFFYGWKFVKKGNYLVGIEWMILGTSSSNAMFYFMTQFPPSFHIAHFFDAFSRAFGLPIVAVAGLMILTHGYRPSIRADISYFVGSALATVVLLWAPFLAAPLPYFLLLMWLVFAAYLGYFAKRLLDAGERTQALWLTLANIASLIVACIYDFYKIPGEETNVFFNFLNIALLVWSWLVVQTYYAYCALERANNKITTVV